MRTDFSQNPLVQHCLRFSLQLIAFAAILEKNHKFVIANQLLKSGTSIGANVLEAQSAESRRDFHHKLKIADKECFETWYWLYLCRNADGYHFDPALQERLDVIMRILNKILLPGKT